MGVDGLHVQAVRCHTGAVLPERCPLLVIGLSRPLGIEAITATSLGPHHPPSCYREITHSNTILPIVNSAPPHWTRTLKSVRT